MSALAPIVQAGHGLLDRLGGHPRPTPKAFDHGGMRLTPIGLNAREIEGFYEGFANRTLWPLYHDAVRAARVPPRVVAELRRDERALRRSDGDRSRRPDATVWVHDYQLQLVPAHAARAAARPAHRLLPAHPASAAGAVHAAAVAPADRRGHARRRRRGLPAARRGAELPADLPAPRRRDADAHGDPLPGPHGAGRRVPGLDRLRRVRRDRRASPRRARGRPTICARRSDRRARCCSASTASTTPRASTCACRRSASCSRAASPIAGETVLVQVAAPSRERVTTYRQLRERVERIVGEHQRRVRAPRPSRRSTTCTTTCRSRSCARSTRAADVMLVTPLRDGMNLVCKEYVASRVARRRRARALASSPARARRAAPGAAREPARRRRHARDDRARDHAAGGRGAPAHARAAPPGAHARRPPLRARRSSRRSPRTAVMEHRSRPSSCRRRRPRPRAGARAAGARAAPARRVRLRRHARADRRRARRGAAAPRVGGGAARAGGARPTPRGRDLGPLAARSRRALAPARGDPPRRQPRHRVRRRLRARAPARGAGAARPPHGRAARDRRRPCPACSSSTSRRASRCTTARPPRRTARPRSTAVREGPARLPGVHPREGKSVVELAVVQADKGDALDAIRHQVGATAAVFVGDDVTDEDAFSRLTGPDVGIKVGAGRHVRRAPRRRTRGRRPAARAPRRDAPRVARRRQRGADRAPRDAGRRQDRRARHAGRPRHVAVPPATRQRAALRRAGRRPHRGLRSRCVRPTTAPRRPSATSTARSRSRRAGRA